MARRWNWGFPYVKVRIRRRGKDIEVSTAVLTSKGQTTIPKDVRDYLGLRPGDRIEFVLTEDKTVLLKPATRPVTDLKGFLPKPPKPVTIEQMNAAIRKRAGR
jgi:AbrB family looped-hinge helix DNA binding protein